MADGVAGSSWTWLPAALTAFGGFATAALSYVLLRSSDARKDERTYQREKAARDEARRDAIIERRNDFQRRTLLHLQDAVQASIRNAAQMHHLDTMAKREGKAWHSQYYPDDLSDKTLLANTRTTKLGVRVRDENIRILVDQFKSECADVLFSSSEQDGDRKLSQASDSFKLLNDLIGIALRQLNEIELTSQSS
jgi:hypothetical protein